LDPKRSSTGLLYVGKSTVSSQALGLRGSTPSWINKGLTAGNVRVFGDYLKVIGTPSITRRPGEPRRQQLGVLGDIIGRGLSVPRSGMAWQPRSTSSGACPSVGDLGGIGGEQFWISENARLNRCNSNRGDPTLQAWPREPRFRPAPRARASGDPGGSMTGEWTAKEIGRMPR